MFEDLAAAVDDLETDDPERFLVAIDTVSAAPAELTRRFVAQLARSDDRGRYLVFERTGRFGSLAIEPLREMLSGDDEELQTIAGVVLLWFDVRDGEEQALRAIRWDHRWLLRTVRGLRRVGSDLGVDLIRAALLHPGLTDYLVIGELAEQLCARGVPLRAAERERLAATAAPQALKDYWQTLCPPDQSGDIPAR